MIESLSEVQKKIKNLENPSSPVTLIAVSKKQPFEKIEMLYRLGQRDFGENYVQELVEKAKEAKKTGLTEIRWHMIGHLQSNKISQVLPWLYAFHALDSVSLAKKISEKLENGIVKSSLKVFLQINIDHEKSKEGFSPDEIKENIGFINRLSGLELCGLMAIPDPEQIPYSFEKMQQLSIQTKDYTKGQLSMGMSSDYELAIQYGATHVRVGSLLFGIRN